LFDALTNERKYRKSFQNHIAVGLLKKESGQQVDAELAEMFLQNIAVYPSGSMVELNTGEVALVVANTRGNIWIELVPERQIKIINIVEDETIMQQLNKEMDDNTGKDRLWA